MSRLFLGCLVVGAAVRSQRAEAAASAEGSGQATSAPDAGDALLPEIEVPVLERPPPAAVLPLPNARDPGDATADFSRIDAAASAGEQRSTAELLAQSPGVTLHRTGDEGQLATVALRGGTPTQTLVLVDGIPLASASGGTADLSTIPPALIDHVDVLRGEAAARYGAGALGGVINVVTRRPGPGEGEAELSYGAYQTLAATASDGAQLGAAAASLALTFSRSDGDFSYAYNPTPDLPTPSATLIRQNNQSLSLGALGSGTARLAGGATELVLQGAFLDRGLAGTEYAPTLHDHATEGRGLMGASWTRPDALGPFTLQLTAHGRVDSLDVQLAGPGSADQLDVEAGIDGALSGALGCQRLSFSVSASDESLADGPQGSPSRGSVGAGLSDRIALWADRLWIVPSARVDQVGPFFGVSPKLGVSLFPTGPIDLRLNLGRGYRVPTFGELYLQQGIAQPNPNLTPETNLSADVGAGLHLRRLQASVAAFVSRYDNLILYEIYPPAAAKPFNEGASLIQGLEADLAATLPADLTLSGSYTFLDTFDDDPGSTTYGRPLPDRPAHHGHGRLRWQRDRLAVTLEADLQSEQALNRAATLSIPGHAEIDGAIAFRLWASPAIWWTVEGKNLANSQAPDLFGYPIPGTSVFTSLRVSEASQGALE